MSARTCVDVSSNTLSNKYVRDNAPEVMGKSTLILCRDGSVTTLSSSRLASCSVCMWGHRGKGAAQQPRTGFWYDTSSKKNTAEFAAANFQRRLGYGKIRLHAGHGLCVAWWGRESNERPKFS